MDNAVGDPQTAEDIKTTIRNARQMSEKAGNMMGKLEDIKVKPSADLLYSGAKDDWKADFNVDIGPETGNFLRAGLDDIGDGDRGNFECVGLDVKAMRTQPDEDCYRHLINSKRIFELLLDKVKHFDYEFQAACVKEQNFEKLEMYVMELLMGIK